LLQASTGITAHDPNTGEEQWRVDVSSDVIPSPVLQHERAFFVTAGGVSAVDIDSMAKQAKPKWTSSRLRPGAASPIVNGKDVYIIERAGVLNCGDVATGKIRWELRLKGDFWATPAIAGDLMYALSQDGLAQVIRLGPERGEVVAENQIGETLQASPAIAGDSIIVRSDQHLWCFRASS